MKKVVLISSIAGVAVVGGSVALVSLVISKKRAKKYKDAKQEEDVNNPPVETTYTEPEGGNGGSQEGGEALNEDKILKVSSFVNNNDKHAFSVVVTNDLDTDIKLKVSTGGVGLKTEDMTVVIAKDRKIMIYSDTQNFKVLTENDVSLFRVNKNGIEKKLSLFAEKIKKAASGDAGSSEAGSGSSTGSNSGSGGTESESGSEVSSNASDAAEE